MIRNYEAIVIFRSNSESLKALSTGCNDRQRSSDRNGSSADLSCFKQSFGPYHPLAVPYCPVCTAVYVVHVVSICTIFRFRSTSTSSRPVRGSRHRESLIPEPAKPFMCKSKDRERVQLGCDRRCYPNGSCDASRTEESPPQSSLAAKLSSARGPHDLNETRFSSSTAHGKEDPTILP